jgi:hypothetical protein
MTLAAGASLLSVVQKLHAKQLPAQEPRRHLDGYALVLDFFWGREGAD